MKIQPGVGNIFDSSALGFSIDTSQQFPDDGQVLIPCPLQIYNLRYDADDELYYINVTPGYVNNLPVDAEYNANPLTGIPPPNIHVFTSGLSGSYINNYIYIGCKNDEGEYPTSDPKPYITVETSLISDTDEVGYLLIGIIAGQTDPETDVDSLYTLNMKGCGSLWSERFKCGQENVIYWWSSV